MSRVLKSHDLATIPRGSLGLDLRDIAAQAEALRLAARQEAERILVQARAQAEELQRQAHQEGYAVGHAQGLAEGRSQGHEAALTEERERLQTQAALLLTTLSTLVQEFDSRRESLHTQAKRDLVTLAIAIAKRVANRLAQIEELAPQMAAEACGEAVALVGEAAQVLVRVHPADAAAVAEMTKELAETFHACRHVRLAEDDSIERGGVRVETPDCEVDATLSGRIDRIADELVTGWRKRLEDWSVSL